MKLTNFPFLVKKEILDYLSINQIFFLSLCSKNIKDFIIQTQRKQFKKVEHIKYFIKDAIVSIDAKSSDIEIWEPTVMCVLNTTSDYPGIRDRALVEEVRVQELGTSVDFFRHSTRPSDLHAKYCSENLESIIEAIHNHLYDLLGHHTKFWIENTLAENAFVPMLRNIQMVHIAGDGFKPTEIDKFLDRSTCLEYFLWMTMYEREEEKKLRENSKIYELDTLYLWSETSLASDVVKYFNGRHAFLMGSRITTKDVIRFLKQWKSGEKFQNLEVISMSSRVETWKIRNAIEFKKVSKKVKYSFIRTFRDKYNSNVDPCEFKSCLYIVRESDGLVASVMLTTYMVFIGVWNMTEKAFLETFQ